MGSRGNSEAYAVHRAVVSPRRRHGGFTFAYSRGFIRVALWSSPHGRQKQQSRGICLGTSKGLPNRPKRRETSTVVILKMSYHHKMMTSVSADVTTRPVGRPRREHFPVPVAELLIEAAIELVGTVGPTDASGRMVCDSIGVRYASVNYNFGSWNGLIAHAASRVYVGYVDVLGEAVQQAPRNPDDRFRAYAMAQVDWARRLPGWGAVLNYPLSAGIASQILQEKFGHVTRPHFELNLARLAQLIVDIREGSVSPNDFDVTNYPRAELLADKLAIARSTMAGWATLGMMVWVSRGLIQQSQIPEEVDLQESLFRVAIDETIASIRADYPPSPNFSAG